METSQLFKQPRVMINGAISQYDVSSFQTTMYGHIDKGITAVSVFVSSNGGEVSSALAIHDLIRILDATGIDIHMITTGLCQSSASWLMTAVPVEKRFATRQTRFLVHPLTVTRNSKALRCDATVPENLVTVANEAFGDDAQAVDSLHESYKLQEIFVDLLVAGTNLNLADVIDLLGADSFFDAIHAKDIGLIGHIL